MKKEVIVILLVLLAVACAQQNTFPNHPDLVASEELLTKQLQRGDKADSIAAFNEYIATANTVEQVTPGNEPVFLYNAANNQCALLIHGFEASPYEVEPLATYLEQQNINVYSARLAGHGTSLENFETATHEDWSQSLNIPVKVLTKVCDKIVVAGVSMGALLALEVARNHDIDAIITIGAPMFYQDKRVMFAGVFKNIIKKTKRNLTDEELDHYYDYFVTSRVAEMAALIKQVRPNLEQITTPLLILQSDVDDRVEPRSAQYLHDSVSSTQKKIIIYEGGEHALIRSEVQMKVFEDIASFIKETTTFLNRVATQE